MKLRNIKDHTEIRQHDGTVLVLGYFDALHLGHKTLFDQARQIADERGLEVAVLTFHESPKLTFVRFTEDLLLHVTSQEKRLELFEAYGVDRLYMTDFTSAFAKTSSDDFIKHYIEKLKAEVVVVGFDYKFGHNRTDADYLSRNFKGEVITVAEQQMGGEKISSSRVRQLIGQGQVDEANQLLGYTFSTKGIVVHGDARGRTIGFPTANLAPIERTILPADGVYVADVMIDGKSYRSMTSVGKNVTFGGTELRLEANIFGFDGDIYGKTINIFWLTKIRDMVKFTGIEELVQQLQADKKVAETFKKA